MWCEILEEDVIAQLYDSRNNEQFAFMILERDTSVRHYTIGRPCLVFIAVSMSAMSTFT